MSNTSPRALICDRNAKWSAPVRARLDEAGIRVVLTPCQAPNANAYDRRRTSLESTGFRVDTHSIDNIGSVEDPFASLALLAAASRRS
jgi:hypothetical protein